eukprot:CAMPEP_0196582430 /NCGR_PEP_ID=MMETSP1081-20130531/38877_1 /TAXON_ID=36882 /ORGANISM="Pyramimonas amylifera, Strain CCMP720" /LENGTH=146 /DNA_ID=CAMNT_0041902985 /DNA_START=119 /DNA_END=559 /DNA_ORIENTATION=+
MNLSSRAKVGELSNSLNSMSVASRPARLDVQMSRKCALTGKKANNGYVVTFSHARNKVLQQPNLQLKKIFWEKENRIVKIKVATSTLKTISKIGLDAVAKRGGVDLYSLPYTDVSPARKDWLAENNKPPKKKNKRAMKKNTTEESA